jgi:hypothetical protein
VVIGVNVCDGFSRMWSRVLPRWKHGVRPSGQTLGFLRAARITKLQITPVKQTEWTEADTIKLSQDGLFDTHEIKSRPRLRKLPYDFHYSYECTTPTGSPSLRKI